jgi:transcriptional regulator with GAF, ATPase, and Fis domain
MAGVFKLRSADICEVLSIEKRDGFLEPAVAAGMPTMREGPLTELRGLQLVSARIARAKDLESLLGGALSALDEVFGFTHGMILVPDDSGTRLVAIAAHGYGNAAIGAEVATGEGLVGSVAQSRHLVRIASVSSELRYGRAIRAEYQEHQRTAVALAAEIPLPRLADAESQMAIPLLVQNRLVGVLALECKTSGTFAQWHEAFLQVLAPGKILWKLLRAYETDGRTEFTNRELRLDPSLGLPQFKDNLESRLILLRKRLEQKCPDIKLVPTKRGRFALCVASKLALAERETA